MTGDIIVEQAPENVRVLTISRPARMNALTSSAVAELLAALDESVEDRAGAVVLTGAGDRAFGAGLDVREHATASVTERDDTQNLFTKLHRTLADFPIPIIAAVNGIAAGASFQFALHCDLMVIGKHAKVGLPELSAGLPCILGSWLLERRLGPALTADLVLTGRWLSAGEAVELGLAARIVEPGEERAAAESIAAEISSRDGEARAVTHEWLRRLRTGPSTSFADALTAADLVLHDSNRSPDTNAADLRLRGGTTHA